jgi:hypothetical protein
LKSEGTDCVGTFCTKRKKCPFIMDKRLKKGEQCSKHIGDVAVHIWLDKERVIMILMYHKDEMHSKVNKANKKGDKTCSCA